MTRVVVALCLVLALGAGRALADPVDTARSVIRAQIKAFLDDDPETAYSFASPGIREKFPDQLVFFEMVKKSYQHLYRPGNFAFGRSKLVGNEVIQEVLIFGSDGKDWTAIYELVPQPDGSYKINGVVMVQTAPGPAL
ncbi:hypothetical protein NGR_c15860 [Sinorhizobium fredii NGR234]|uniref:DUF4864 domain-containing protein n=1 Tax=Sinorhizobium fredii (strain NBRC 101917 / NGR234) TaxID=394 RepID=C3MD33_SINFN|nr:DUF4864 domain-containing protein [Sinorhizobium fredii]ACP25352.1 hypothetical protein NGR_c15860 [Sinorhizobium fredii NGR234]